MIPFLFSAVPCDPDSVRGHPRARTRTAGKESATDPVPEVVRAADGKAGVGHQPWIQRNRPRAGLASAWIPSAATCEADARFLPLIVATKSAGSGWHGGSAPR